MIRILHRRRMSALRSWQASFTLVELLISISIIAILAAAALFALYGALDAAKESRTRAQIARLHDVIMGKWDSYLSRPIRIALLPGTDPTIASQLRLIGVRDLMRMELPDRITDVYDDPIPGMTEPSLHKAYRRLVSSTLGKPRSPAPAGWFLNTQPNDGIVPSGVWSYTHEGSECLYLILSMMRDDDGSALEFFLPSEIGDTDNDGMNEVLDAWGRPIEYMRWAPGYATGPGPDLAWGVANTDDDGNGSVDDEIEMGWPGSDDESQLQSRDSSSSPDPFDPLRVDPRNNYALFPLIMSAGRDETVGIEMQVDLNLTNNTPTPTQDLLHYVNTPGWSNDPYYVNSASYLGRPVAATAGDNITNHEMDAR